VAGAAGDGRVGGEAAVTDGVGTAGTAQTAKTREAAEITEAAESDEATETDAVDAAADAPESEAAATNAAESEATASDATEADAATDTATDAAPAASETDTAPAGSRRRRTLPILLAVAALALLLDVISKLTVVATLSDRAPVRLPGGFLYLTLLRNSGAAFSIGESQTWVFTIIAVGVVVAILRVSRRLRSVPWACALGLLLGGALGNLGDRVFRSPGLFRGHVVDFLQFPTFPVVHYDFPVFNLADSSIVVGGCLMVLLSFLGIQPDGTRHQPEGKAGAQPEAEQPESELPEAEQAENKAENKKA
jgi:signal peptidase II